mmetsp:Transcript_47985/g.114218  ORF Transcript_47985/g.114218 Transcript_47985/m.114218 type:complete len:374 (-) Transcript_47985:340-1461(-)
MRGTPLAGVTRQVMRRRAGGPLAPGEHRAEPHSVEALRARAPGEGRSLREGRQLRGPGHRGEHGAEGVREAFVDSGCVVDLHPGKVSAGGLLLLLVVKHVPQLLRDRVGILRLRAVLRREDVARVLHLGHHLFPRRTGPEVLFLQHRSVDVDSRKVPTRSGVVRLAAQRRALPRGRILPEVMLPILRVHVLPAAALERPRVGGVPRDQGRRLLGRARRAVLDRGPLLGCCAGAEGRGVRRRHGGCGGGEDVERAERLLAHRVLHLLLRVRVAGEEHLVQLALDVRGALPALVHRGDAQDAAVEPLLRAVALLVAARLRADGRPARDELGASEAVGALQRPPQHRAPLLARQRDAAREPVRGEVLHGELLLRHG